MKVIITDPLATEGVEALEKRAAEEGISLTVDLAYDLDPAGLLERIGEYDGLIVRSGTKVTADVIQASRKLKVIGRAGTGVDNIDLRAATQAGVLVVNAPTANCRAAAEHAVALMFALARRIARADASVRHGEWKRRQFMGVQIAGKVLGLVGLGRVGSEVVRRTKGLGMTVLAYDPYLSTERARGLGVELANLDDLLGQADFVSMHTPLTEETRGLIGAREFALMKPTAYLINCARGPVVDEDALLEALGQGQIAGAGLDVFAQEPPSESPLLHNPNVVLTPHLGASTEEAQVEVAREVTRDVLDGLLGRPVRNAVNAPMFSPEMLEALVPYIDLAERLGRLAVQIAGRNISRIHITYGGRLTDHDMTPVKAAVIKGLLELISEERVNQVNANLVAQRRGLIVVEEKRPHLDVEQFRNLITLRVGEGDAAREVSGTLRWGEPLLVRIDEYWINLVLRGYMLICTNLDRPGMIGQVGTMLGREDVNISFMQVGRDRPLGYAVMAIGLDDAPPEGLLDEIQNVEDIYSVQLVKV